MEHGSGKARQERRDEEGQVTQRLVMDCRGMDWISRIGYARCEAEWRDAVGLGQQGKAGKAMCDKERLERA